jgi:hypothetical protein
MDVEGLVVRDGDRVAASGRLVRNRDGDWFEPALPFRLPFAIERRVAAPWRGAVRIARASFDGLTNRFELDGAVEGYATVTGTWSDDQFRAIRQTTPENSPHRYPRWETPPCPPPAGGWPRLDWGRGSWGRGEYNLDYDLGDLADTGAAVAVTTFRPSEDQAVLVVAAADRDAVEARLRPQLGDLLCVVTSRWTKAELDAVRAHLHAQWEQWNLYQLGPSNGEDGQTCMGAQLTRVLQEIADWGGSLPRGILALEPWLRHADREPSDPLDRQVVQCCLSVIAAWGVVPHPSSLIAR